MNQIKMKEKTAKYKFFSHKECEYFPCHNTDDVENFNCLFCCCPLYVLGDRCGGKFGYTEEGVKDCSACMIPHRKDSYDYIMSKWQEISELAGKRRNEKR